MKLDQIRKQATEILNIVSARVVEGGVTQKTVAEVWAFRDDILADVTAVMNGGKRREDILADVKALSLIGYQGRFLQGTRKEEPSTGELLLKNVLEVVYADEINRILKKKPVSRGTLQDWVNKWYSKDAWYQTRMEASRLQEAEKVGQSKNIPQGVTPKDPWITDTGTMAFPLRNALTFGSRELLKHRWAKMPKDRLAGFKPMYHPDGDSPSYRIRGMGGDYQVSNHRYQDLGKQTPTQSRQASDKVWLEGLYSAHVNDVKDTYDRLLWQIEAATTPDDLKSLGYYNIEYFRQHAEDSPIEEDINRMAVELEAELEKKKVALGELPKEEIRRDAPNPDDFPFALDDELEIEEPLETSRQLLLAECMREIHSSFLNAKTSQEVSGLFSTFGRQAKNFTPKQRTDFLECLLVNFQAAIKRVESDNGLPVQLMSEAEERGLLEYQGTQVSPNLSLVSSQEIQSIQRRRPEYTYNRLLGELAKVDSEDSASVASFSQQVQAFAATAHNSEASAEIIGMAEYLHQKLRDLGV